MFNLIVNFIHLSFHSFPMKAINNFVLKYMVEKKLKYILIIILLSTRKITVLGSNQLEKISVTNLIKFIRICIKCVKNKKYFYYSIHFQLRSIILLYMPDQYNRFHIFSNEFCVTKHSYWRWDESLSFSLWPRCFQPSNHFRPIILLRHILQTEPYLNW